MREIGARKVAAFALAGTLLSVAVLIAAASGRLVVRYGSEAADTAVIGVVIASWIVALVVTAWRPGR